MDTEPEETYDELTRLAAQICGVPVATISLIDENRQWYKSKVGMDMKETPRDVSFCNQTIQQTELLVVPDATKDCRFANNPYVVNNPNVRFYAGLSAAVAGRVRHRQPLRRRCPSQGPDRGPEEGRWKCSAARLSRSSNCAAACASEHKQALQALQTSEERFREFAGRVDDLFLDHGSRADEIRQPGVRAHLGAGRWPISTPRRRSTSTPSTPMTGNGVRAAYAQIPRRHPGRILSRAAPRRHDPLGCARPRLPAPRRQRRGRSRLRHRLRHHAAKGNRERARPLLSRPRSIS